MAININGTGSITGLSSISSPTISGGSVPLGDATAPGIVFSGDPNTGIYSPGADQVAISTNSSGRLFIDASGNVGVGTASPFSSNGTNLHVLSTGTARLWLQSTTASTGRQFYVESLGTGGLTVVDGTAGQERLRITAAGLVGIGTSSPSELFQCQGNARFDKGGNRWITIDAGTNATYDSRIDASHTLIFRSYTAAGGTPPSMVFDTSGRLGIGTTSPARTLHVAGSAVFSDTVDTTIWAQFSTGVGGIGTNNNYPFAFATNGTERARIDSSGRLLVGTSSYSFAATAVLQGNSSASNEDATLRMNRGGTPGANADLGLITFGDNAGNIGASIRATNDTASSWGSGDYPGRLTFSTTSDGSASPTARIIINNSGTLYPATDNAFQAGSPGYRWTAIYAVNGTIQTSDARQKTDVSSCSLGSAFIKSLQPVSYKWIEGGNTVTKSEDGTDVVTPVPGERTHWGFLAQDVKAAVDNAGVDFGGWILTDKDDPDSAQGLRYDQFIAPLTKALQETMAELEALKAEVAALKAQ